MPDSYRAHQNPQTNGNNLFVCIFVGWSTKQLSTLSNPSDREEELAEISPSEGRQQREFSLAQRHALLLVAAAFLTVLLLRSAWVTEDAYISFRVVDNFLNGHGLRWNIDERVQAYTDPLFQGLVIAATWLSGNVYLSTIVLSLAATLTAFLLITWNAAEIGLVTAAIALIFSKAFIDFSVSGLENPVTHLAIALYLFAYWRKRDPLTLSLIAALAATNRMDTVLFFLPSLAGVYLRIGWKKIWKPALIGWSPLIMWSAFSLFYYGFLFPNTAYAKLHTGISTRDMIFQGLTYYLDGLRTDTASIYVILLGLVVAWVARERLLGFGIVLNLLYVVRVGGDFMLGRFFSAALFFSVAILARYWNPGRAAAAATLVLIAGMGMWIPLPTITSARSDLTTVMPPVDPAGIADERAAFYQASGLLRYRRDVIWPEHGWSVAGEQAKSGKEKTVVFPPIGMYGYHAGPGIHIIDIAGLADALLARLPMQAGTWRIGHFWRDIPPGYVETVQTGKNAIVDPNIHEFYDHLHTVIGGDLWSFNRFKEIFLFNIGYYEHLLPQRR